MCLAIDSTVCFLLKTGPCQPTVIQPEAGVDLPPFFNEQNVLTVSAFAGLKKLSNRQGTSALPVTALMEQIPVNSGRAWKERYSDLQHRDGLKMDPIITDGCAKKSPD
jgi:hypothetical protein